MNQKEVSELRRRFRAEKSAISRIYGCYVNSKREIIAQLDLSLGNLQQREVEQYLGLVKKALSGTVGKNLMDISFATRQVADSEEHRLLSALRATELKDEGVRDAFYQRVIQCLDMGESNYLILLAHDAYDVPHRGKDDVLQPDGSESVFHYIVCSICPVKDGKPELIYVPGEEMFHSSTVRQSVSAPELGFLFPAFEDRSANIYNALFYTRKADALHQEFIDGVFHTTPPMSAAEQREAFETALTEGLEEACSMEVVQRIHERLLDKLEQHRESRDPDLLVMTIGELGRILRDCDVPEERVEAFDQKCSALFGVGAELNPANLIDSRRFEVKTPQATVSIDPENSRLVEMRDIGGRQYLLIPAEDGVEVNGLSVAAGVD
jgi:hypothetical protein